VLRNPTNAQIADCLDLTPPSTRAICTIWSLWVRVPARPRRRRVRRLGGTWSADDRVTFPGGQAGASSKIENYLGFSDRHFRSGADRPRAGAGGKIWCQGSGRESSVRLHCDSRPYAVEIDGGERIQARALVIATGAEYRRPGA